MNLGALAGAVLAAGLLLVSAVLHDRRPGLVERVAPYARERSRGSGLLAAAVPGASATRLSGVVGDVLLAAAERAAGLLESLGSSSGSVRRRLAASGSRLTVAELRLQQLAWAGAALGGVLVKALKQGDTFGIAVIGNKGAPPLLLNKVSLILQLIDRRADGSAADIEHGLQLGLRRQDITGS